MLNHELLTRKCFTHSGTSARWQEIQGTHEGTRSTKFRIPVKIIIPPPASDYILGRISSIK